MPPTPCSGPGRRRPASTPSSPLPAPPPDGITRVVWPPPLARVGTPSFPGPACRSTPPRSREPLVSPSGCGCGPTPGSALAGDQSQETRLQGSVGSTAGPRVWPLAPGPGHLASSSVTAAPLWRRPTRLEEGELGSPPRPTPWGAGPTGGEQPDSVPARLRLVRWWVSGQQSHVWFVSAGRKLGRIFPQRSQKHSHLRGKTRPCWRARGFRM